MKSQIFYNEDKAEIDKRLVADFVGMVSKILNQKPTCNIAIAGGRSIASILDVLAGENLNWDKLHVFAVDDRCLPLDDEESNSHLIKQHLIDKVPVNFHPYIYNPEAEDRGASDYSAELDKYGGKFDVLILSAGEDGHTAGLFPGHQSFANDSEGYIFFNDSPKLPPERISATRKTLLKSNSAFILFVGEGKQEAYERFLDKKVPLADCPSKLVQNLPEAFIYTDRLTP